MSENDDKADERNAFRAFFAFGAIVIAALVVWNVLNPPSKKAYNPHAGAASYEGSGAPLVPPLRIDPETGETREATYQEIEQWRAERSDLAAQWKTADMAQLAFVMGVLGMVLLGWTVLETRTAADNTSAALRVSQAMNSIVQSEQRPWVSVDVMEIAPRLAYELFNQNGESQLMMALRARVSLTNSGKLPAEKVECFGGFFLGEDRSELDDAIDEWRHRQRRLPVTIPPGGSFEVEEERVESSVVFTPPDMVSELTLTPRVRLAILIKYQFGQSEAETYYEASIYSILRDAEGSFSGIFFSRVSDILNNRGGEFHEFGKRWVTTSMT